MSDVVVVQSVYCQFLLIFVCDSIQSMKSQRIPTSTKIEWTEQADSGKSIEEIREEAEWNPDPRTITRAIKKIRNDRARRQVREEALKDGLKNHWTSILEILNQVPGKSFDWINMNPRPAYSLTPRNFRGDQWQARRPGSTWCIEFNFETEIDAILLKEHLPDDRLWQLVDDLREAISEAVTARLELIRLLHKSLTVLVQGIDSEQSQDVVDASGLHRAEAYLLQRVRSSEALRRPDLKFEATGVWIEDSLLSTDSGFTPEEVEDALKSPVGTQEWKALLSADAAVDRIRTELTFERDVLIRSTMLPGECDLCKRYSV